MLVQVRCFADFRGERVSSCFYTSVFNGNLHALKGLRTLGPMPSVETPALLCSRLPGGRVMVVEKTKIDRPGICALLVNHYLRIGPYRNTVIH